MKILIYGINYAPEPVGIGKYTGELGTWLVEQGNDVRAIAAPPYFPGWEVVCNRYRSERLSGVWVKRCPLWVPKNPSGLTRLLHLASFAISSMPVLLMQWKWRPDLILCIAPTLMCAPGALVLKKLSGKECVTWLHIQDLELDAAFELGLLKGEKVRKTMGHIESWLLKNFDQVSTISSSMRDQIMTKGVDHTRCQQFSNWIDLEEIKVESRSKRDENRYRKMLGIKPEEIILLYSGSMNKKQGIEIVVEAIRLLSKQKNLVWILAGEGPGKNELKAATENFDQVRHRGLQAHEHLSEWLNVADIHILPQKRGVADLVLPSKVHGMLASGRPVIATTPKESCLGVVAEEAGIRVNPGDVTGFVAAVLDLANDPVKRERLGLKAREIAERNYSKEMILKQFQERAINLVHKGMR